MGDSHKASAQADELRDREQNGEPSRLSWPAHYELGAIVTANGRRVYQYPPPQYAPSHGGGAPPEEALTLPIMPG
jgi:hypothetical protein